MLRVGNLLRRLSGDKKSQKSEVASDAIMAAEQGNKNKEQGNEPVDLEERNLNQNGSAKPESVANLQNIVPKDGQSAENCFKCVTPFATQRPAGKITCCRCLMSFCFPCLNLKKTESLPILKRHDFHWSCNECTAIVYEMFKQNFDRIGGGSAPPKPESEMIASLLPAITEKVIEPIKAEIRSEFEKCMSEKVPEAIDHSVNVSISKTWASVAGELGSDGAESSEGGNPETDFSIVVSKKQQRAAAAQIQALKQAAAQQNIDEKSRDERMKNVILFKVPEPKAESKEGKEQEDEKFVVGLLKAMKVNDDDESSGSLRPDKIYRLGKFDSARTSPRPIKLEFLSKTDQNLVMNNAKNLKNAPKEYKSVNVNYDLSETDRQELSALLTTARDK